MQKVDGVELDNRGFRSFCGEQGKLPFHFALEQKQYARGRRSDYPRLH